MTDETNPAYYQAGKCACGKSLGTDKKEKH